jgi:hypothetical protein
MSKSSLQWIGRRVTQEVIKATLQGMYKGGELLLEKSNAIVPLDEGPLQDSGAVDTDKVSKVSVYYDTDYAIDQHENLQYSHSAGREAKYLENSALRNEAGIIETVGEETKKILKE